MFFAASEAREKHARSESPGSTKPPLMPRANNSSITNNNTATIRPQLANSKVQELRVICTTCTPCEGCGRLMYDEEVMAEWVAAGVDAITCPSCLKATINPRLTVRTVAILESTAPGGGLMSNGLIESSVPFLSPLVLRRQLEIILGRFSLPMLGRMLLALSLNLTQNVISRIYFITVNILLGYIWMRLHNEGF